MGLRLTFSGLGYFPALGELIDEFQIDYHADLIFA